MHFFSATCSKESPTAQIRISVSTDFDEAQTHRYPDSLDVPAPSAGNVQSCSEPRDRTRGKSCGCDCPPRLRKITAPNHKAGIRGFLVGCEPGGRESLPSCTAPGELRGAGMCLTQPERKDCTPQSWQKRISLQGQVGSPSAGFASSPGEGTQLRSCSQGLHFTPHLKIQGRGIDLNSKDGCAVQMKSKHRWKVAACTQLKHRPCFYLHCFRFRGGMQLALI